MIGVLDGLPEATAMGDDLARAIGDALDPDAGQAEMAVLAVDPVAPVAPDSTLRAGLAALAGRARLATFAALTVAPDGTRRAGLAALAGQARLAALAGAPGLAVAPALAVLAVAAVAGRCGVQHGLGGLGLDEGAEYGAHPLQALVLAFSQLGADLEQRGLDAFGDDRCRLGRPGC